MPSKLSVTSAGEQTPCFLILITFICRKPVALTSMRGHTKSAHTMSIGGETCPLKCNLIQYTTVSRLQGQVWEPQDPDPREDLPQVWTLSAGWAGGLGCSCTLSCGTAFKLFFCQYLHNVNLNNSMIYFDTFAQLYI